MTIIHFDSRKAGSFSSMVKDMQLELIAQNPILLGEWQSQKIDSRMREMHNVIVSYPLPQSPEVLAVETGAHLPWAEDHFLERVGGEPLNPSPSEAWWPFAQKKQGNTNADHKSEGEAFSHTYPERIWPKQAGPKHEPFAGMFSTSINEGIRFDYGDLGDVVDQLYKTPHTRQAFLPIWFPEDTGAVHGKRVPCTIGYQFTVRNDILSITYFMRSTDLLRHFQDDIYLAGRLAQWVAQQINERRSDLSMDARRMRVGELTFHTVNLHIFEQDADLIKFRHSQGQVL